MLMIAQTASSDVWCFVIRRIGGVETQNFCLLAEVKNLPLLSDGHTKGHGEYFHELLAAFCDRRHILFRRESRRCSFVSDRSRKQEVDV